MSDASKVFQPRTISSIDGGAMGGAGMIAAGAAFVVGGVVRILVRSADKLAVALFAFGIAALANVPAIHIGFDEAMGVAEYANCIEHVGALLGTFFFVAALRDVGLPGEANLPSRPPVLQRRGRRPGLYWGVATAAVVATVALWAASDLPREAPDFTAAYGDQWTVAGYWAIGIGFVGWGLVELARTTLRVARYSNRAEVRGGLWVATVGVVAGLAYSATKIAQFVAHPLGWANTVGATADAAGHALLGPGLIVIGVGLMAPAIGRGVRTVAAARAARPVTELMPLWAALTAPVEHVSLGLTPADLAADDPRLAVTRATTEIHDAILVLRHYVDDDLVAAAAARRPALGAQASAALAEACWLQVAVQRKLAGLAAVSATPPVQRRSGGRAREIDYLRTVARSWEAPAVQRFAREHGQVSVVWAKQGGS
jgi:hypothetical protein